jgi:hypothetical protein
MLSFAPIVDKVLEKKKNLHKSFLPTATKMGLKKIESMEVASTRMNIDLFSTIESLI